MDYPTAEFGARAVSTYQEMGADRTGDDGTVIAAPPRPNFNDVLFRKSNVVLTGSSHGPMKAPK
jgi:hypothetical protein